MVLLTMPWRPGLVTLYLEQVDVAAHRDGTFSPAALAAMGEVDAALARLLRGLEARGLRASTNVVVLSDHGMLDVPRAQVAWLDALLPTAAYQLPWWPQVLGVVASPGRRDEVATALLGRHAHFACWRRAETPPHWHFRTHPRIPPIVCQADPGWRIQSRGQPTQEAAVKGEHGFAPEDPSMRAAFVADGPDFIDGTRMPGFDNVDVYPLLARLLRVKPAPHDGDTTTFDAVLEAAP